MRDAIVEKLYNLQDVKYQKFHSKLCPGTTNIIGVRTPELRKLAKEILRGDYQKFLQKVRNEYYEETLLEGLVIAEAKLPLAEKIDLIQKFVPKINNWAVCDLVCSSFKFKTHELPEIWNFITKYQTSSQEFELRFMIVMMMDYFLTTKKLPEVFAIVNQIKSEAYYVKMAIAWLVSMALIKQRDETLAFLEKNNLPDWTQNKAIQKIRESYRVSDADKQLVLRYKR